MKILVPLDHSEYALKALCRAVEMVKKEGGELTLLTVTPSLSGAEEASVQFGRELEENALDAMEKGRMVVEEAGVAFRAFIEAGKSPADSIVEFARKDRSDLVVMGHRGLTGFSRFLLGSVAAKVVSHAPCSVLVVR